MSRVLAVDPGTRRVGLALSDPDRRIATPLRAIDADGDLASRLAAIVSANDVSEVVVGLPLRLDGTEGPAAAQARGLAAEIGEAAGVPVTLVDERLTTAQAHRTLREVGVSEKRRRKVADQAAATLLLQGYLDAKRK